MSCFHFCTIATISHTYKVLALRDSLLKINPNFTLHVLIVDNSFFLKDLKDEYNVRWYLLEGLDLEIGKRIRAKYEKKHDKLRWSLKPVFLSYLLKEDISRKIIYIDNDIAFFNDYEFIFEKLEKYNVLLTPHYYPINPNENQNWLEANFKVGLYNAGFFACNNKASDALNWWANCCLYRCERNPIRGLWDDQKYLDILPIHFEKVKVLQHKGCNLADWNESILKRKEIDGDVLIANKWNPVFIHFTGTTINNFLQGNDILLKKYFYEYVSLLKKYKPNLNISDESYTLNTFEKIKLAVWRFINNFNKM